MPYNIDKDGKPIWFCARCGQQINLNVEHVCE